MGESTTLGRPGDRLITASQAGKMAGLSRRQFLRTAEAAGLRLVRFPGLAPKLYNSEVKKLVADVLAQGAA